jgi:hypothetical protein
MRFCNLFVLLFLCIVPVISLRAQPTFLVKGKVTDPMGEPVIGAVVKLKEFPEIAVATDFDGNYVLKVKNAGTYTLQVSMMSFSGYEKTITLNNAKEVVIVNADLQDAAKEIKTVVIEAKQEKAKDYYFDKLKRNSVTTFDFISSEVLKRTGDANVGTAVARIPGISTNGNFFTVRGIGDRYIRTSINGYKIPTLDPFTNNFRLDIFPASLVDNIVVNKSVSADLPADWAGAYISVETKDFPDNLVVQVETQIGFNANTTGKNILSANRSKTDWLGFDNTFREYNHQAFAEVNDDPTFYQQMKGLGLEGYYQSLGVSDKTKWNTDLEKLGYVQLGLLKKADFNNTDALTKARDAYKEGKYYDKAFTNINNEAVKQAQAIPTNFDLRYRTAPPALSQSFTLGNTSLLGHGRQLGWLIAGKYSANIQYDPYSLLRRVAIDANNEKAISFNSEQELARENNSWSTLFNVSYKAGENHTISYLFMPNITGSLRLRSGIDTLGDQFNRYNRDQFYESRKVLVHQLNYKWFIPSLKVRIDAGASATFGKSNAPDFKRLRFTEEKVLKQYLLGPDGAAKFYRYLEENAYDFRINAERPVFEKEGLSRKIKIGSSYSLQTRDYNQYNYTMVFGTGAPGLKQLDINRFDDFFSPDAFGIMPDFLGQISVPIRYNRDDLSSNRTTGFQKVWAGYASLDFSVNKRLRFYGGLRAEQVKLNSDVFKYDSLAYAVNDPRRFEIPGDFFLVNPGKIEALDLFPSASVIYKFYTPESGAVSDIRLNYGRSTARPSIREMSETFVYDFELQANVFGNSNLKPVYIQNIDVRLEHFFANNDFITLSLFRKDLVNHIEMTQSGPGFTWQNADKSFVTGIEWDAKFTLFKNLEFRNNFSFIKSETNLIQNLFLISGGQKVFQPIDTVRRVMFGQAPYVVNLMMTYTLPKLKTVLSASYNLQGKRLVISSEQPSILPDVYEMPRHLLDARIMQPFGKHYQVSVSARDILNAPVLREYIFPDGSKDTFDVFTPRSFYFVTFTYKL